MSGKGGQPQAAEKLARMRERAARLNTPTESGSVAPLSSGSALQVPPVSRVETVRCTVDLPRSDHEQLRAWLAETARALEVNRVSAQQLLAALVRLYLADPALRSAAANEVRDARQR